jgi:hypothetical protein
LHNQDGRASLIFQVRADSHFPEDRLTELVLPAGVLVEEHRPGHLLFGLPRLSLAVWRASVSSHWDDRAKVLLEKIRQRLLTGHSSVSEIFHDAPDGRIRKVFSGAASKKGGSREVIVYYQRYRPTERMADHTWFERTSEFAVILDNRNAPQIEAQSQCVSGVLPKSSQQLIQGFNIPLQSAIITASLGILILKLLFLQ